MPLLNTADAIYLGASAADRVYLGANQVWPFTSGLDVLESCEFYVNPATYSGTGNLTNLGVSGGALDATMGASTAAPMFLPYIGVNYVAQIANSGTCSAPASSAYNPIVSLSVRQAVALSDWTPASATVQLCLRSLAAGNQNSWQFNVIASGALRMILSANGSTIVNVDSTVATGFSDGSLNAVRADWTPGVVTFYYKSTTESTSYADIISNTGWTQLGTSVIVSTPLTLFAATSTPLSVSPALTGIVPKKTYATEVIVDGAVVFSSGPLDIVDGSAITYTATSGQTVSVARPTTGYKTVFVTRPLFLFDGSNDVMTVADNALLDFGASDSFTLGVAVRQWLNISGDAGYISKQNSAASPGWRLRASNTLAASTVVIGAVSGSTTGSASPTYTNGTLQILTGIRDTVADTITTYTGSSPGTSVTDTTVGGLANAIAMSIGRGNNSTTYNAFEFYGAFVARRVLTPTELAAVVSYLSV